jgi:hypothetical protein
MMPAQYQDLVVPSLRRLLKHQRQHDVRQRYESRFLHSVADQLRWQGVDLPALPGPWTVGARWLQGPGRGGLPVIPLVQRANTVVMTDTWDEARRLAGLLNWCHAPSLAQPFASLDRTTQQIPSNEPVAHPRSEGGPLPCR